MRNTATITGLLALLAGWSGLTGCSRSDVVGDTPIATKRTCEFQVTAQPYWCEERDYNDLPTTGAITISSRNGSAAAAGASRSTVTMRAYVYAQALTQQRAKDIVAQVVVHTTADNFYATGPTEMSGETWGVSFDGATPATANLSANSSNGDVVLAGLSGQLSFSANNGSAALSGLAGRLSGSTSNGEIVLDLAGTYWNGTGVDLQSANGDVTFRVPANYSGQFSLQATNGDVDSDFPGGTYTQPTPTQANYQLTLGNGGAMQRAVITNGSGHVRRK